MESEAVRDLQTRDDIESVVRAFYSKGFDDDLLRPLFIDAGHLDKRFDEHVETVTDFWSTVLFHTGEYKGGAFIPHRALHEKMSMGKQHFDRWVELWTRAVTNSFAGERAEAAVKQGQRFANNFQKRLAALDAENQSDGQADGNEAVILTSKPKQI